MKNPVQEAFTSLQPGTLLSEELETLETVLPVQRLASVLRPAKGLCPCFDQREKDVSKSNATMRIQRCLIGSSQLLT